MQIDTNLRLNLLVLARTNLFQGQSVYINANPMEDFQILTYKLRVTCATFLILQHKKFSVHDTTHPVRFKMNFELERPAGEYIWQFTNRIFNFFETFPQNIELDIGTTNAWPFRNGKRIATQSINQLVIVFATSF